MKTAFDQRIEDGRCKVGHFASPNGKPYGLFFLRGPCGRDLKILVSDGADTGWEHVSVSLEGKHPPNWQEMCWVKEHFWQDDETVLQFHPQRSSYVNIHPNCLHLWRQVAINHVLPPQVLV